MTRKGTSRGLYGESFLSGEAQKAARQRAGHRCEQCGIEFEVGTNRAVRVVNVNGRPVIGTVHHIDWDPANEAPENLVYLCQACHTAVHGHGWRPGDIIPLAWKEQLPRWIVERGLAWRDHPQMRLFEESESV